MIIIIIIIIITFFASLSLQPGSVDEPMNGERFGLDSPDEYEHKQVAGPGSSLDLGSGISDPTS